MRYPPPVALAVVLAVGLGAVAVVLVLAVGLFRHLKVLATSLRRFQEDVQPILVEIQRQSATAQDRIQRFSEQPGGRLRS